VKPKRQKVEPIRNPTLFEVEKSEEAPNTLAVDRPSLPAILLGTSFGNCNFYSLRIGPRRRPCIEVDELEVSDPDSTLGKGRRFSRELKAEIMQRLKNGERPFDLERKYKLCFDSKIRIGSGQSPMISR
jgi:hypothetical protein